MELDDFKIKGKEFENFEQNDEQSTQGNFNSLIMDLKAADLKARRKTIFFMIIIFSFIAVYSSVLTRQNGPVSIGYEILIGGFFLILIYGFSQFLRVKNIDYTAPAIVFLKKAERRHAFMKLSDWFITVPLIAILGTGGGFIVYYSFSAYHVNYQLLTVIYTILFIMLVIFGFWASRKNWKKEKGEILERIKKMRQEIEKEG